MQDKVYEFWYNECFYESAPTCISLHRTQKGAGMAMEFHKKQIADEYAEIEMDIPDYMDWGISERIIEVEEYKPNIK